MIKLLTLADYVTSKSKHQNVPIKVCCTLIRRPKTTMINRVFLFFQGELPVHIHTRKCCLFLLLIANLDVVSDKLVPQLR